MKKYLVKTALLMALPLGIALADQTPLNLITIQNGNTIYQLPQINVSITGDSVPGMSTIWNGFSPISYSYNSSPKKDNLTTTLSFPSGSTLDVENKGPSQCNFQVSGNVVQIYSNNGIGIETISVYKVAIRNPPMYTVSCSTLNEQF